MNLFKKERNKDNLQTAQELCLKRQSEKTDVDHQLSLMKRNQACIVNRINNKIEETGHISESLIDMIGHINRYVELQMNAIEKVVDEVNSHSTLSQEVYSSTENIRQISKQTAVAAQEGNRAVENSIQAMNEIENSVKETKQFIQMLSTKADSIYDMVNVIKDIASSTNLLSLNASIEAARAGEAGRGFAVVAQEVKKLAQHSIESTEYINRTVQEINSYLQNTNVSMNKTIEKVNEGARIAGYTKDTFQTIINAIESNNTVSHEISAAISQQTNNLENIVRSIDEMSLTFEKLLSLVETASSSTQYTKTSLQSLYNVSTDLKTVTGKLLQVIESAAYHEQALHTSIPSRLQTLDPNVSWDFVAGQVLANVHSGLLSLGNDGEVSPGIAKSWRLQDDNLTWIFNLRTGAKFHSGREVTAHDVKYSFERLLNPKLNSHNSWCLLYVDGAEEYMKGAAKEVAGINIIDKYCISIRLKYPYSGFLLTIGQYACAIMDREELEKGNIVGCGSYTLSDVQETEYILRSFPEHYNGEPYVDRFHIHIAPKDAAEELLRGSYDFIVVDNKDLMQKVKDRKDVQLTSRNIPGSYFVGFNLRSSGSFVRDREVRKAMNLAVNKKRIIEDILGGMSVESVGPLPPSILNSRNIKGYPYNPDTAKDIMKRYSHGNKLKFHMRKDEDSALVKMYNQIGEYIVEDLKAIGIECIIERYSHAEYLRPEVLRKCDIYISRWMGDTGDPDNFVQPLFHPENMSNGTGYNNPAVNEKMKLAQGMVNPRKRAELYHEIQQIIVDDAPWIFLFHPKIAAASRGGLIGLNISSLGIIKLEDILIDKHKAQ